MSLFTNFELVDFLFMASAIALCLILLGMLIALLRDRWILYMLIGLLCLPISLPYRLIAGCASHQRMDS